MTGLKYLISFAVAALMLAAPDPADAKDAKAGAIKAEAQIKSLSTQERFRLRSLNRLKRLHQPNLRYQHRPTHPGLVRNPQTRRRIDLRQRFN